MPVTLGNTSITSSTGTLDVVDTLHVHNSSETGYATNAATSLSRATLSLRPHATDSPRILFGSLDTSVNNAIAGSAYIQRGNGTSAWDLHLQPFGGRVLMPNQPRARFFYNQSTTGVVTNMTVIENNQNLFSVTNGQIFVPVSGWYSITAYGISLDQFDTRIIKNTTNNSPFLGDFRQSSHFGGTHHGCGNTVVAHLTAGDYVVIHRLSGTMYTAATSVNPHNQISIHFLG